MSVFYLRTKLKPELNLVMQIIEFGTATLPDILLASYTGSDEQRWILTPAGYLMSCKQSATGKNWLVSSEGGPGLKIIESGSIDYENGPDDLKWSFDEKGRLISKKTKLAVDIPYLRAEVGTILQMYSTNAGDNQVWMIDRPIGSRFVLRSKLKPELNLVMQICPNTNDIRLAVYNGSDEQRWILTPAGYLVSCKKSATGNNWFVHSKGEGGLKIEEEEFDINYPPSGGLDSYFKGSQWSFDEKGRLISRLNQLAIDIPNSDAKDGAILQTYSTNADGDNQVWMITDRPLGNGFVLRASVKPELDLVMQICPSTNDIRLASYTGSDEQRWILTPAGYLVSCKQSATGKNWFVSTAGPQKLELVESDHDFNYDDGPATLKWSFDVKGRLISKWNQLAIDIPYSDAKDGAILQTYSTNAGDSQVWIITNRPNVSGFVLRTKKDPLLVLECNGSKVSLRKYNESDWQRWTLTPEGYLLSIASGMMLTTDKSYVGLAYAQKGETTKWKFDDKGRIISLSPLGYAITTLTAKGIAAASPSDSDDQKFLIGLNSPSYFYLQNMESGLVLGTDIETEIGASVSMYEKDKTSGMPLEQLFKFRDGFLVSGRSEYIGNTGECVVLQSGSLREIGENVYEQLWDFQFDFTGVTMINMGNKKVFVGNAFEDPNPLALHQKWWIIPVKDFKGAMVMTINYDPDKVVNKEQIIQVDDGLYISIAITDDMKPGQVIQVITGYQTPTTATPVTYKWLDKGLEVGVEYVVGKVKKYTVNQVTELITFFVSTKSMEIFTAKFIAESNSVVLFKVAQQIETGALALVKNGFKIGTKIFQFGADIAERYGIKVAENAFAKIASWGLKSVAGGPFFEVTIAATIGGFAFSKIAEALGGNRLVVGIADVVGGTLAGAGVGALLGGPVGAAIGAAIGGIFELISVLFGELIHQASGWIIHEAELFVSAIVGVFKDSENDYTLTIVNSTPYDWTQKTVSSFQMIDWDKSFPKMLPAGHSVVCQIRGIKESPWSELTQHQLTKNDTGAVSFSTDDGKEVQITYRYDKYMTARASFDTLQLSKNVEFDLLNSEVFEGYSDTVLHLAGSMQNGDCEVYTGSSFTVRIMLTKHREFHLCYTPDGGIALTPDFKIRLISKNSDGLHKSAYFWSNWFFSDDGYISTRLDSSRTFVLEIRDGNPNPGAELRVSSSKTGSLSQKWTLGANGTIVSMLNNLVIDVADDKLEDGAKIIMWPADGGDNQNWTTRHGDEKSLLQQ